MTPCQLLAYLWYFDHCSQTTSADIDGTRCAVDLDATTLHVQYEAAARAMLRMGYVVAIHWLALTDVTTTCCHVFSSRKNLNGAQPSLPLSICEASNKQRGELSVNSLLD